MNSDEFIEHVVKINRIAKVVKGGRRFGFSALVVVGDGKGKVGYGLGKAREVSEAIKKGSSQAKGRLQTIQMKETTIPYEAIGHFGAARVFLKPASQGTGVIAGGAVRAVMESAGVRDVLTKSLGSKNVINTVKATMAGLEELARVTRRTQRRLQGS